MNDDGAPQVLVDGPRYAVYWVPSRSHPLWRAGCDWLARDPEHEVASQPPAHAKVPWRYGFHATLKPPMRLREGAAEAALADDIARVADGLHVFAMPPLQVAWLGRFLALRPVDPISASHPLRRLADACVEQLDRWRRAPTAHERTHRSTAAHDARQRAYLERWGYPYVFDAWRFHLTLSDDAPAEPEAVQWLARRHFAAALREPLAGDEIALFREDGAAAPLRLLRRFRLRDGAR